MIDWIDTIRTKIYKRESEIENSNFIFNEAELDLRI